MPGVDLALDLPSVSDALAVIVAKFVDALQDIEDDLADQVVSSEININSELSFNGAAITNLGSATFVSGNIPTTAGSVWYDGTEWYVSDSTGTIQVTSNGSLNIASVGGIVGDYGGSNPARVTYDDASGEYRFTEDTGVYADLVADDLILHSATGSVRFSVDDDITTNRQFIIDDIPASGVSLLIYDASDSSLKSAENVRVTNTPKITSLDRTGNLYHGNITDIQGLDSVISGSVSVGGSSIPQYSVVTGSTVTVPFQAPLIPGISRVKSFAVTFENNTLPSIAYRTVANPTTAVEITTGLGITGDAGTAVDGSHTKRTFTINSPTIIPSGSRPNFALTNNAPSTLKVFNIEVTYDAPAP